MAKKTPAKKPSAKAAVPKKSVVAAPKAKAPAGGSKAVPPRPKGAAKPAAKSPVKAAAPVKSGAKAPAKAPVKAQAKGGAKDAKDAKKTGVKGAEGLGKKKAASVTEAAAKGKALKQGVASGGADPSKRAGAAEAASKGSGKLVGKGGAAPVAKGEKAAATTPKPVPAKGASSSKKGGSKASARSGDQTGTPGHAFLSEPGPRFRSPFSGSATTAKEAAARMAELAGLTAIRAASVKQAPTLKKFKKITETPLPEKQLEEFREILEVKREQLVGDVSSMEKEALGGDGGSLSRLPQHMADQGTDTYDQSLNLDLAASQRSIVKEIDAALDRIVKRTFGVCELLGKPIGIDRLRNAPWTRYSIEAARMLELNPELARVGGGSSDGSGDDDTDDDV